MSAASATTALVAGTPTGEGCVPHFLSAPLFHEVPSCRGETPWVVMYGDFMTTRGRLWQCTKVYLAAACQHASGVVAQLYVCLTPLCAQGEQERAEPAEQVHGGGICAAQAGHRSRHAAPGDRGHRPVAALPEGTERDQTSIILRSLSSPVSCGLCSACIMHGVCSAVSGEVLTGVWRFCRKGPLATPVWERSCTDDAVLCCMQNVLPEKLFTKERAVQQLLGIIDGVTMRDNGRFIAWDGQDIPF